ncbi:MAG TPA: hypothetical protein VHE30_03320 [Polyangiaceae bacterium]|nr:hypothetical protein [Polyangiaceae bacterium]
MSDVPLPPIPRDSTPPPAPRSDFAPRTSQTGSALPDLKPPPAPATVPGGEVPDADVAFPPGAFSPDDAIDEQIADLERWALANERRERTENVRFWVLRGGAFAGAALAAIEGFLGYGRAAGVLAGIASVFVAVDAAWPGTNPRNPHRRAVHDLRSLQNSVKLKWDKVRLAYPNPTGARRVANALALLDAISTKREDIGRYLGSAEASPGTKREKA